MAKMTITNPDQLEATLEITLTLPKWLKLGKQLDNDYPAFFIKNEIRDLIYQIDKTYYAKPEEEGEVE
jgi:hypothetical protein